jgi:hypothetical protein
MTVPRIQLHNGSSDWDGTFQEHTCARAHHLKIPGAFYTSSERHDGGSAWTDWASTDMPHLIRNASFRYEVTGTPNALVLRTDGDLISAYKQLGLISHGAIIDEPSLLMMEPLFLHDFRDRVVEQYMHPHPARFRPVQLHRVSLRLRDDGLVPARIISHFGRESYIRSDRGQSNQRCTLYSLD